MKALFLIVILGGLAACGPTGTKLDDVFYPMKSCSQDMTVENQGTAPMQMFVAISESTHDAACDSPQFARVDKSVAPGAKESLHVELQCRQCWLHKSYSVTKVDKSTVLYDDSMGSADVFCSDVACLGR